LKVSPYEVKQWRERAERLPFEQFVIEEGADDDP
jgi:hypothetical protein